MTQTHDVEPGQEGSGHGFGTLPVFLTGLSTILGAVMFLRFGYAVGNVGLLGTLAIIVLGHLVTIPTALAIAEIATNRKVEGGGEYFIISRSFGTTIGGVIGLSLYFSQAISVAFYMIAFAEAFQPLGPWFESHFQTAFDPRYVSIPATLLLLLLVLTKGADVGLKALYIVAAILLVALVLFFAGSPVDGFDSSSVSLTQTNLTNPDSFFIVFAIVFPAFTGMTAGVGLSGDLASPRHSLPRGTLGATVIGMILYVGIIAKLAYSAPAEMLDSDQLVMARIALWGPIILIGLGAATLSSSIGSILVAPRTLQALGSDQSLPGGERVNAWFARGVGAVNEPRNTTLVTGALALLIVALGNVNIVARLISMFFMVTYGSLCAISFLEHFAARPSYRPSFRSRWYASLLGAVMCLLLMFQMDPIFAVLALVLMSALYVLMKRLRSGEDDLAEMFQGVMTQATRNMHIRLQRRTDEGEWRPSVIMVSERTFDRRAPLIFLRWLCHRHGFGTYLHLILGQLNADSYLESKRIKQRLLALARKQKSTVYMETLVSPSMVSALAQSLQVPGVSGLKNNTVLFEFAQHDPAGVVSEVVEDCLFASSTEMSLLVLRHGDFHFGERANIHIWLTWNDQDNANLMLLLSYILLGHPDWSGAEISVFAAAPENELAKQRDDFSRLMAEGRLPVSEKNLSFLPTNDMESYRALVAERSDDADLVVIGFRLESLFIRKEAIFNNHPTLKDVLFVHTPETIKME